MELFFTCLRSLNRSKEGKNGGEKEVEEDEDDEEDDEEEKTKGNMTSDDIIYNDRRT